MKFYLILMLYYYLTAVQSNGIINWTQFNSKQFTIASGWLIEVKIVIDVITGKGDNQVINTTIWQMQPKQTYLMCLADIIVKIYSTGSMPQ